ncbi:FAD-binding oxidoreductase [Elongatibacter sediminis]|uniref:FAD-binding oxidoreductase n=1 Tax=Elongatibacter sediminis TaxID=3119006 RepID=A0AAW9REK9_9GAMM
MNTRNAPGALRELQSACPDVEISTEPAVLESHGLDWTRFRDPAPLAVAFPRKLEDVQALVRHACGAGLAIVPSGGRTGLSGGAVAAGGELVVSFDRMRQMLEFDPVDASIRVEAGMTTGAVQEFAAANDLYYPVSFASEGTSQIGGNIATNAGGIRVLRHGLTRERVTGLKVVTGTGAVLECNRGLIKNASGYDLRHLFIGSEGTLGLIVEATLRLERRPPPGKVMLLGLTGLDALMNVFSDLRRTVALSAFEFLTDKALAHVCAGHELSRPLETECPLYVVAEFDCPGDEAEEAALASFERGVERGWLADGIIAQSAAQNAELWRYREGISESITALRPYKNDLSVRISRVPEFLQRMDALVAEIASDYEVVWYGHIGDGNLHMNIIGPEGLGPDEFEARCHEISNRTYALTEEMGGSISAEHGLGLLKSPWLGRARSAAEIEAMRAIKRVFDPAGILNPGKLFPNDG